MSVVINMKMPQSCKKCDFSIFAGSSYWCSKCGEWCPDADKRLDNCPILTELPEKHGRLFDSDEVKKVLNELPDSEDKWSAIALLEWAIDKRWCIEAEGAE